MSRSMKLSYVSASNPIEGIAGGQITVNNWIEAFLDAGIDVDVITWGPNSVTESDGLYVHALDDVRPEGEIRRLLKERGTDVVLTQGGWSDVALRIADELAVPSILSIAGDPRLHHGSGKRGPVTEHPPTEIIANSRYTQQWIAEWYGRDSTLIYPHIDFDFYTVKSDEPRDAITMINPVEPKGGYLFKEIAEVFPDEEFVAKAGWYMCREDPPGDMSWNLDWFRILAQTYTGLQEPSDDYLQYSFSPQEAMFDPDSNVTWVPEMNILDVYARTKILLVPSQYIEAFGRVVLEAMWNGIPVIASNRGGLPEACGGAGMLVDEYDDLSAWKEKIERMQSPGVYETFAERGRRRAERFEQSQDERMDKFVATVRRTATRD